MKNTLQLSLLSLLSISLIPAACAMDAASILKDPNIKKAALIIDVQDDFTEPNSYKKTPTKPGSLPVADSGDAYLAKVIAKTTYVKQYAQVIASQDFHPDNHKAFVENNPDSAVFTSLERTITTKTGELKKILQVLWPKHCVQGTEGADILVPAHLIDLVVHEGINAELDSHSAFEDDGEHETSLNAELNQRNIDTLFAYGIADEYGVKFSVLDALKNGKRVFVIKDLCRGDSPSDSAKAFEEMEKAGATIINSDDL